MTDFVVIIPARLASTRLPRKPLADIGGAPMVVRVAQKAAASGAQRVLVAGDHEEIVTACRTHGVECLLTSTSHPTGTDRIAEAAAMLRLSPTDVVVNVQGDEPLIPSRVIGQVASALTTHEDCAIATAACPLREADEFFNPNIVKVVVDREKRALLFSRAPIPWARDAFATDRSRLPENLSARRHIGLYAYRTSFLLAYPHLSRDSLEEFESLEQLRALSHGYRIAVEDLDSPLPPGVDTPADLELARAAYSSQR